MEFLIFPFLMVFYLGFFALILLSFVFWIMMLVDCAKRKFKNENDKVVWIIIVAILGVLGAVVYYFVIKRPNQR